MTPETVAVLESLGVNFERSVGHRFRGISFIENGSQVSADFPREQGIGLRRPLLHEHQKCHKHFNPVMVCSECGEPLLAKEVHVHDGPGKRVVAELEKPAKVAIAPDNPVTTF